MRGCETRIHRSGGSLGRTAGSRMTRPAGSRTYGQAQKAERSPPGSVHGPADGCQLTGWPSVARGAACPGSSPDDQPATSAAGGEAGGRTAPLGTGGNGRVQVSGRDGSATGTGALAGTGAPATGRGGGGIRRCGWG
jgi:hypothetical protein